MSTCFVSPFVLRFHASTTAAERTLRDLKARHLHRSCAVCTGRPNGNQFYRETAILSPFTSKFYCWRPDFAIDADHW